MPRGIEDGPFAPNVSAHLSVARKHAAAPCRNEAEPFVRRCFQAATACLPVTTSLQ